MPRRVPRARESRLRALFFLPMYLFFLFHQGKGRSPGIYWLGLSVPHSFFRSLLVGTAPDPAAGRRHPGTPARTTGDSLRRVHTTWPDGTGQDFPQALKGRSWDDSFLIRVQFMLSILQVHTYMQYMQVAETFDRDPAVQEEVFFFFSGLGKR